MPDDVTLTPTTRFPARRRFADWLGANDLGDLTVETFVHERTVHLAQWCNSSVRNAESTPLVLAEVVTAEEACKKCMSHLLRGTTGSGNICEVARCAGAEATLDAGPSRSDDAAAWLAKLAAVDKRLSTRHVLTDAAHPEGAHVIAITGRLQARVHEEIRRAKAAAQGRGLSGDLKLRIAKEAGFRTRPNRLEARMRPVPADAPTMLVADRNGSVSDTTMFGKACTAMTLSVGGEGRLMAAPAWAVPWLIMRLADHGRTGASVEVATAPTEDPEVIDAVAALWGSGMSLAEAASAALHVTA